MNSVLLQDIIKYKKQKESIMFELGLILCIIGVVCLIAMLYITIIKEGGFKMTFLANGLMCLATIIPIIVGVILMIIEKGV